MRSIKVRRAIGAISFMALATTAGAAIAQTLVVRAIGPSAAAYPPGKKLAENSRITLKPRDVITLLDARGTRTLTGPGVFPVSAAAGGGRATNVLAALTDQRTDRRVRIGAVRNVEGVTDTRPNIWMVDVTQPGPVCVTDPAAITLWRPDPSKAAQGSISELDGKASVQLSWAPGQAAQPWPAGLSAKSGARYRLALGAAAPIEIRPVLITPAPTDLPGMADAMLRNGCKTQLDQVVATANEVQAAGQ